MGSLTVHSVESNKLVAVLVSQDGVITHDKWVEFKDYWKMEFKGTPLESVPLVLLPRYTNVIVLEEKDKSNGQEVQKTQEATQSTGISNDPVLLAVGRGHGLHPNVVIADGRDAPPTSGPQPTTTDTIVGVSQPPAIVPIPQKATEVTEAPTGPVFTTETLEKVE